MPLPPLTYRPGLRGWLVALPVVTFGMGSLILLNAIQLASLVVRPWSRKAFRKVNRRIAALWWGGCVVVAEKFNGTRIIVTGDDVPQDENALLVVNHQQMPDITALLAYSRSKGRTGDLKFFVKHALKWVPGIGWGMQFLSCPFLRRDWSRDRTRVARTFETLVGERIPMWLVTFAEGTRVTKAKLATTAAWAAERGLEPTRHVLLPRTKGFVATIEGLGQHIEAVYDITIAYHDGVPTLWQYITGGVDHIHLHVRRFTRAELPESTTALSAWLIDRFREKDELLEHFYHHGSFEDATAAEIDAPRMAANG